MQKVFHFDSPREVYDADACVISCYDARFDLALRKYLKRCGIALYDHLKLAGGPKSLATPECDSDRDMVIRMIRVSLRLHNPQRLLLFGHNECGAYPDAPPSVVILDVVRAGEVVGKTLPGLPVECYFTDFDGVYRIA